MNNRLLISSLAAALALAPFAAGAQTVTSGISAGAAEGSRTGGPVGAVLGGVAGGVIGGVSEGAHALQGAARWPTLQDYVREYQIPSHHYAGQLKPGVNVPKGVAIYPVPAQYGDSRLLFTVVNDQIVLIHPHTRRIIQIVSPA